MTTFSILRQVINISRGNFRELPREVEEIIGEISDRHAREETPYLAPKELRASVALRACLERLAAIA